mgnify:CR=1 FL=1
MRDNDFTKDLSKDPAKVGSLLLRYTTTDMPIHKELISSEECKQFFRDKIIVVNSHLERKTGVIVEALSKICERVLVSSAMVKSVDQAVLAYIKTLQHVETFIDIEYDENDLEDGWANIIKEVNDSKRGVVILDDGAHIIETANKRNLPLNNIISYVEQTTKGANKISQLYSNLIGFPTVLVGYSDFKAKIENQEALGESTVAKTITYTNDQINNSTCVIVGYGSVGKGIAKKCIALGGKVIICEINQMRRNEAERDGYEAISRLADRIHLADFVFTATGSTKPVVTRDDILKAKNGCRFINVGSGRYEIDMKFLDSILRRYSITSNDGSILETIYFLDNKNERYIRVLTDGYPINLYKIDPLYSGDPPRVIDAILSLMIKSAIEATKYRSNRYIIQTSELNVEEWINNEWNKCYKH